MVVVLWFYPSMPVALGRFAKCPWMPSVRSFLRTLGQRGARIQAAEVALRYFENTGPEAPEAFAKFLSKQATRFGLAIGLNDFREARSSAAIWYVVEAIQLWNSFTKSLVIEYRRLKGGTNWKARDGSRTLTAIDQLFLNLPKPIAKALIKEPEFCIISHYLAVRNWIVHPNSDTLREAEGTLNGLTNFATYLRERYPAVKAPNPVSSLQFDDYMLLSRACVVYAAIINDACDLQNEDIEPQLFVAKKRLLRNHTMPLARIRNTARRYFSFHHGSNRIRRDEFAEYVVCRFEAGEYSRATHDAIGAYRGPKKAR